MLNDLLTAFTNAELAGVMGRKPSIPLFGGFMQTEGGRKLIWLYHTMLFQPWLIRDWFDVLTWGRFRDKPEPQVEDWDYSI